ncbi:MAG: hypothetical protein AAGE94_09840, partial [Acidobacteriota bacterium]
MAIGSRFTPREIAGRPGVWAVVLAVVASIALATMASMRTPLGEVWADEGTFLAMAESLAEDGDLWFTDEDRERLDGAEIGRSALILERTPGGIAYSKPVVLPLVAAPFYALFGSSGLVVLNGLALLVALTLAAWVLARLEARDDAPAGSGRLVWVTFLFAGVVVPYVFWRMADLLQLTLVLGGLSLVLAADRGLTSSSPTGWLERFVSWRGAPWLGTALVAMTVSMRVSNGALAVVPVLSALFAGQWRRAFGRAGVVVAVVALLAATTWGFTGALDPYRAERTTFVPSVGYPTGDDAEEALGRFDLAPATHHAMLPGAREIAYGSLYVLIGRHSGLLIYFPAALLFALAALRRSDAAGRACLVGAGVAITFFAVAKPENFFGGETFLGNRYFLSIYPALLFAPARLPRARGLVAVWLVALLGYGSAVTSVARSHHLDDGSQSHARAGLFRLLPYESTAQAIEGRRDRYWAGQFVRFIDPFAEVEPFAFELEAGRPATEVMVVHWQPPGALRYVVTTEAADATLVVDDYRREHRFAVGRGEGTDGLVNLDVVTARPWRYHRFWFEDQVYWARVLRLELDAPAGTRARLVHLGDPAVAESTFSYRLMDAVVPEVVGAGSEGGITLRFENTSRNHWEARDTTPVTARWRLSRHGETVADGIWRLTERVAPGGVVDLELDLPWPVEPGPVEVEVAYVPDEVEGDPGDSVFLRVHKLLKGRYTWAAVFAVIGAIIYGTYSYRNVELTYASTGEIEIQAVVPTLQKGLEDRFLPMVNQFITSQMKMIRSQDVIEAAVKNEEWTRAGGQQSPEAQLIFASQLFVRRADDSNIIDIIFI